MATTFFTKKANNDGMVHIFVRVRNRKTGFDCRMGTNLYIDEKIWKHKDDANYMRKYKDNQLIQKIFITMMDIFKTCEDKLHEGKEVNNQIIQDLVLSCVYREQEERRKKEEEEKRLEALKAGRMTLNKYVDMFLEEAKNGSRVTEKGTKYSQGTITSISQAVRRLKEFQEDSHRVYDFDDINMEFYKGFISHLNKQKKALNTIGKTVNWLKTLMSMAETEGYHTSQTYKDKSFKGARVEVDSIYLTKEDLDKIRAVDLSKHGYGYELARDIFMIGVWTAQRISDYNNIKKEDIQTHKIHKIVEKDDPEHPGEKIPTIETKEVTVVNITQKKTGTKLSVPCSTELKQIFEKYNYEIPHLSDQNVNDNMKKIAEEAGLTEQIRIDFVKGGEKDFAMKRKCDLVHTHTARRTGATLMYLSGMDIYDIMKITGHSTPQTLKKYIKADKLEVMEKIVDKYDYFN